MMKDDAEGVEIRDVSPKKADLLLNEGWRKVGEVRNYTPKATKRHMPLMQTKPG